MAPAVAGSSGATGPTGAGGASPGQPGSSGATRTAATVRSTSACDPDSSAIVDEPLTVRPSRWIVRWTPSVSSATFWWITELAKRVSARRLRLIDTSTSAAGSAAPTSSTSCVASRCSSLMLHSVHLRPTACRARKLADAHARTPTLTLRKRAGAAGWPVWPVWPGWPLPQLGVPHATVSDESMSIDRQNCGPIPV